MHELVIIGAGGFAAEVVFLAQAVLQHCPKEPPFSLRGVIAPGSLPSSVLDLPVLGDDNWAWAHLAPQTRFVVALGDPEMRSQIAAQYHKRGWHAFNLIHPEVVIHPSNQIGQGCMICAGVKITTQVQLGNHVLLNLNCTVGHDAVVGDYCTLSPSANLSGAVSLGRKVYIGSGATVLPGVNVGEKAVLGAGGVATRDLMANTTYVGIPARPLPSRNRDDRDAAK